MTLPKQPERSQFPASPRGQEEFEEAVGFWRSRVGRLKGIAGVTWKVPIPAGNPIASAMQETDAELQQVRRGVITPSDPEPSKAEMAPQSLDSQTRLLSKAQIDELAQTKGMDSLEFMEAVDAHLRADFGAKAKPRH